MTSRKPKPRKPAPRKASGPTLMARIEFLEAIRENDGECLEEINRRLAALEARDHLRDKSHDAPVSNAGEAVGQSAHVAQPSRWRRFLNFMESP